MFSELKDPDFISASQLQGVTHLPQLAKTLGRVFSTCQKVAQPSASNLQPHTSLPRCLPRFYAEYPAIYEAIPCTYASYECYDDLTDDLRNIQLAHTTAGYNLRGKGQIDKIGERGEGARRKNTHLSHAHTYIHYRPHSILRFCQINDLDTPPSTSTTQPPLSTSQQNGAQLPNHLRTPPAHIFRRRRPSLLR